MNMLQTDEIRGELERIALDPGKLSHGRKFERRCPEERVANLVYRVFLGGGFDHGLQIAPPNSESVLCGLGEGGRIDVDASFDGEG